MNSREQATPALTREQWIEQQAAKAPRPTWERWLAANAALGIYVKRKAEHATATPAQSERD